MGDHDAPEAWLDRWRDAEPVRLYLWTVASAMLAAGVVAGWWTADLSLALAGVVAAILTVGGASASRAAAFSPRTVKRLENEWLEETEEALQDQHERSWTRGAEAALAGLEQTQRTPEKVAAETRPQEAAQPATRALGVQAAWREQMPPCRYVHIEEEADPDTGLQFRRRCVLPRHPDTFPHRLEEEATTE